MNHSHARAAARSFGGGGSPAPRPSRIRAEVASRMPSTSVFTSGTLPTPSISLR